MGSKKKKEAESESRRLSRLAETTAAYIQPSPEHKAIAQQSFLDWEQLRKGDIAGHPIIASYLTRAGRARREAENTDLFGGLSLAQRAVNPTLLTMGQRQRLQQGYQDDALAITDLAAQQEQIAAERVAGFSGAQAGLAATRAGLYGNLSQDWFERYKFYSQQGGFWKGLLSTAIGVGLGAFTGGIGSALSSKVLKPG